MLWLPYYKLRFQTDLSLQSVIDRLLEVVEPEKSVGLRIKIRDFGHEKYLFDGKVTGHTFKITRIIHYHNSFLPVISGGVTHDLNQTTVRLQFKLTYFMYIFILLFLVFDLIIISFFLYFYFTRNNSHYNLPVLIPIATLLFGYLMMIAGFGIEVNKAKKLLLKL